MSKDPEFRLMEALNYSFTRRTLYLEAITHRSFVNEVNGGTEQESGTSDNERFEFLGDAVLDLVVSTELMKRFPSAREGELSRMRASIVHEGALAQLARDIGLGAILRLGRGEQRSGGRERASLLADAFEAMVAAIYLDAGFHATTEVILPLLDFTAGERLADTDPKTELQHRCQATLKLTPRYRLVASEGPEHEKRFVVEVVVEHDVLGQGTGRSKKQAEQNAAQSVLDEWNAE
ncbi:MAG: ribonuclease III [Myxococcales bacterium]|nr:ribonuclease III [Myxococcales bacterium]